MNLLKFKKKHIEIFSYLLLLFIFITSIYYSYIYSINHTDFHHWSFILEKFYQFINGQQIYKEIYLQYGEGYIWLFKLLNFVIDINLVSIGIITGVLHASKIIIIYFVCKNFCKNQILSILIASSYFLSITHIQSPWPDYYAGFFLILFFLYLIKSVNFKKKRDLIICSIFLFLTFYFRPTYILVIFLGYLTYFFLEILFLRRNKVLLIIFLIFSLYLAIYLIILLINDNLMLWLEQNFLGLKDFLGEYNILNVKVNKYIYLIVKLFWHLLVPKNAFHAIISLVIYTNIILFIYFNFIKKKNIFKNHKEKNLFFLFFSFGLSSVTQTLYNYEIFRILNSGISFFIIFSFLLANDEINKSIKKIILLLFLVINGKVISYFPLSSHYHSINDKKLEKNSSANFNYFGKRNLNNNYISFYSNLQNDICKYNNIINLSLQKELSFFCNKKKYIYKTRLFLENLNVTDIKQILIDNKSNEKVLIISNSKVSDLRLLKEYNLPSLYRFTFSDTYMRYHSNKIYLYSYEN